MKRAALACLAILLAACSLATNASPSPTKTPDIRRGKLDIAYSAFVDFDVHHVTSKKALESALAAVKELARSAGGKDDVATPEFNDVDEVRLDDFKKFADAVSTLASRNTQLSADRIADTAIAGMIKASPDCHTQYVDRSGAVYNSGNFTSRGSAALIPAQGTSLGGPDQAGLTAKILPGGIAYITFREFLVTGTYKITDAVHAILDKAVAQGAKAWLFDLRGNPGGNGADLMASWFLNGEPTLATVVKTGTSGTASAVKELRLPAPYQLPIAVIVNDRSASASEVFTASLKENGRATILGQKTIGCLGATSPTHLSDGAELNVVVQEFIGAKTGAKYNGSGVVPDVQVDDPAAVDTAIALLMKKL